MGDPLPRGATDGDGPDTATAALVDAAGFGRNSRLGSDMVASVLQMGRDGVDRGDLKLVASTLGELRRSFEVFEPYRDIPKASVFGSARTRPGQPAWEAAHRLGAALARAGWMVITGGGPGIMTAAVEGAGADRSFGVHISLPFEPEEDSPVPPERSVRFRYFFNRKVTFMKESAGFVLLPGGFGTLDEAFELLTLLQTGRSQPAPVVLFEPTGDAYWRSFLHFLDVELADAELVSRDDLETFTITSDVDEAVEELRSFYRVYHSMRYVGEWLVIRLRSDIDDRRLADIDAAFADIVSDGHIERCGPTSAEKSDDDHVDLPRIRLRFVRARYARLNALVRALNAPG